MDGRRVAGRHEGGGGRLRHRPRVPGNPGAALYEALQAHPSERWPVLADARIPTLLVLATEPAETRETTERLLPRFLEAVPQADVVRPGCRHQVFADLGAGAGELVASWLPGRNLPSTPLRSPA